MTRHLFIVAVLLAVFSEGCRPDLATIRREALAIDHLPAISPDYTGVTIPPNIAPLNFVLKDTGTASVVEIASVNGPPVVVWAKQGAFRINPVEWRLLLAKNTGNPLRFTIFVRSGKDRWRRYATIEDTIAKEEIDRYCTYRLLSYQYNYSSDLRECQRDLSTFEEKTLVDVKHFSWGCVNCHTPMKNDPRRFVLQVRSAAYGSETIIATGDTLATLESRLGYAAWHPDGGMIAFTVYKVEQYFHAVGKQCIDVYDDHSRIVIYDAARRTLAAAPWQDGGSGALETWPAWSPDGRYLYFCNSPVLWNNDGREPPENFNKTRYSLLRVGYDPAGRTWGTVDTILSPAETGLSITQPRISPDNTFCLFCMQDSGAYPHARPGSDLYLMDLRTRQYQKLPVNSEQSESWHAWSKNGRWILFSSKRGTGVFTRLYISHVDSAGNVGRPFVLPQRDGAFYESFVKCYNVPELAAEPVRFSERELLRAVKTQNRVAVPLPPDGADAASSTTPPAWRPAPGTHQ